MIVQILTSNHLSESPLVLALTLSTLKDWNNSTFIWNQFLSKDTVTQTSKWYWVKKIQRDPTVGVLWNRSKGYFNHHPISVRLGFRWTTGLNLSLLNQIRSCYDMGLFGVHIQISRRMSQVSEVRFFWKTQHVTTDADIRWLCCGSSGSTTGAICRLLLFLFSVVENIWTPSQKIPELKNGYAITNTCHSDKNCMFKNDERCFELESPREWYPPHHLFFQTHKRSKVGLVLNGAAKLHGTSIKTKLLPGLTCYSP